MAGITTSESMSGEQPKDELPIMECERVTWADGIERYEFDCPKCGEKRVHSALDGHRESHCRDEINDNQNCWPSGYILKERDGR